ncbi:DUF4276 family protein [Haliangium sp.]|uniref:DUF4276 family protein n=1 Tax=Haliangium sp. TaxID=2663208 RepID=UPI003D10C941
MRDAVTSPEHIDEGAETAPSKRLLKLFPGYDKPSFGSLVSQQIGLEAIRRECPHFSQWVARLESLSS